MSNAIPFFLLSLFLISVFPRATFAHVLENDNGIGAELHIDPDDYSIAGEPVTLHFSFRDEKGIFEPSDCDCTVIISTSGEPSFSATLAPGSGRDASEMGLHHVFAQPGVYRITVSGRPIPGHAFQPFSLEYTVRVNPPSEDSTSFLSKRFYFVGVFLGISLLIFLTIILYGRLANQKP